MKSQTGSPAPAASAAQVLDLGVAVVDFYFRIEALTQATAGFAQAGGEWGVLRALTTEGPQTVPAMARSRPVSRQHCQSIVNLLHEKGLVRFIDNPRHKRSRLVEATEAGHARFATMQAQFLQIAGAFATHFTAEEIAVATSVCRRGRDMLPT